MDDRLVVKKKTWLEKIPRWRFQVVIFVLPVLFILASLYFALESSLFLLRSEKAEGEVVKVYEWDGETFMDGGKVYSPLVRYRWSDGEFTENTLGMSHQDWNLPLQSKVNILYDPNTKTNLRLSGFFFNWALPSILLALGLLTLLPAFLAWRALKRKLDEPIT